MDRHSNQTTSLHDRVASNCIGQLFNCTLTANLIDDVKNRLDTSLQDKFTFDMRHLLATAHDAIDMAVAQRKATTEIKFWYSSDKHTDILSDKLVELLKFEGFYVLEAGVCCNLAFVVVSLHKPEPEPTKWYTRLLQWFNNKFNTSKAKLSEG